MKEPERLQGDPSDAIETDIYCAITKFAKGKQPTQVTLPCRVLCCYSEGVLSISIRERSMMISVRVDELCAILQASSQAAARWSVSEERVREEHETK